MKLFGQSNEVVLFILLFGYNFVFKSVNANGLKVKFLQLLKNDKKLKDLQVHILC